MSFSSFVFVTIGIALVEALDPITYIVLFKVLATKNPIKNFIYFIIPYSGLMFLFGMVILIFGNALAQYLNQPTTDFQKWIIAGIGIVILLYGFFQYFKSSVKKKKEKVQKMKLQGSGSFITGVVLFFINLPMSVAFFGLILLILKEKLPFSEGMFIIFLFTILFTAPYVLTAIFYKKYEAKIKKLLDKIFKFLGNKFVFGTILALIGLYLIFG
ncbi:GAP family protein [Patescibacteria group bacterium]|nr:GAP family protein [Patescibacteria group bacterium]MBU1674038.1 GAP family protein [Patescibacteria group bacterium]MBU1963186.1 GAP family protein [Patescibacteria group bacterium]